MSHLNIKIESKEVKSEVRALRAKWTPEMAKDLDTHHGLSIESLLREVFIRRNRKKSIKNIFPDKTNNT
jgi:hypothetical protein